MGRRWLTALVSFVMITWSLPFASNVANAISPDLVISQVYGGGGNTGATLKNDYIEIFNRGATDVSLSGKSVQYASSAGSFTQTTALTGTLAAGQYYLIQEAVGAGGTTNLPAPEASGTIAMSATGGKVALVGSTAALGCGATGTTPAPCSAAQLALVIDLVGYDGATMFEGTGAAPTLTNTTAAVRGNSGCTDTDNNAADFTAGSPAPRNTASPTHNCNDIAPTVIGTTPTDGATGIAIDANVSVQFSEAVNVTSTAFTLTCATSGSHAAAVSGGPTTFTLDPTADFANEEQCTVTVVAAQVTDQDTDDPPDAMAANYTFAFRTAAAVIPTATHITISQVYGGGGNAGATLKNDFIELHNPTSTTVDLSGWSVQYTSSSGTSWAVTTLFGVIEPGTYYLVQEAQGAGGSADLPTPNAVGAIAMSATAGKVALRSNATAFAGACPVGAVDFIGYGAASCSETAPTAVLSNTTAAIRKQSGDQDTDNNSADFDIAAPAPRSTADHAPTITSTTPANNAGTVPANANVTVSFSEPVNVSGSWFSINCSLTGAHTATVSGGPTSYTLDPDSDFNATGETCIARVFAANVRDADANDPPDTMTTDYQWSFAVVIAAVTFRIHDVQGASHLSPFLGIAVANVPGVVTQLRPGGFYMQDPSPDGDDRTAEGISVSSSTAVTVGDAVTVSGNVTEPRTAAGNLSTTTIAATSVTVSTHGNALPAAVRIGIDRTPPTENIEDDASGDVETSGVFDPATDGIDFWESLEGMRIDLGTPVVTGPSSFHELSVLANNGAGATGRTARGGIKISATDKNPEKVIVKGVGFDMPDANTGDHLVGPIVGVVDYDFGNFMVQVATKPTLVRDGVTRETTTPPGFHELTIATFNVENLDPNDGATKFDTLASLIVNNLLSPDVISLEEVQDNNGATDNGVVAANVTLAMLRDAIAVAGGPTYDWREIDPVNDQDGGEPGGNIRQVFFFRTDRGVQFVDRPGAGSTTANSVVNTPGGPQLLYSPGRIQPADAAFNTSRKPLAAEFTYNGHHLFVIANHWNSKGGDDALWGHRQPPVLSSETQRRAQATIVRNFVSTILSADTSAEIVVLGDLNDFEFSTPVTILKGAGLTDLIETLPENERYSYVFEGNSQTLDHILASSRLVSEGARTDVVHVNSEFWDQASDHEPQVAALPLRDSTLPVVHAPGDVSVATGPTATSCSTFVSDTSLGTATATDNLEGKVTVTRTGVPSGNVFPVGSTTITYTAHDSDGNIATATQTVTVVDETPPSITAPANMRYQLASEVPAASASDANAADNCGPVTISVTETSNGGAGSPASPLVLTRTYTAIDGSGNASSAHQTITVIDDTRPTISAPANVTVRTGAAATTCNTLVTDATLGAATGSDNSGHVTITRSPAGNTFPVGSTTVVWTATDPSGNTATANQTVTVIDDTPPSITAPADVTRAATGVTTLVSDADLGTATVGDNCPGVTVTRTGVPAGNLFPHGTTTITYTSRDVAGNETVATQRVTLTATTASVCAVARSYISNADLASSLCAKLDAAAASLQRGNLRSHDGQLAAFINEVNAQRGKALTDTQADTLIGLVGAL